MTLGRWAIVVPPVYSSSLPTVFRSAYGAMRRMSFLPRSQIYGYSSTLPSVPHILISRPVA